MSRTLERAVPGGYDVSGSPTAKTARDSIVNRHVDVAVVLRPHGDLLLVATAVRSSLATTTVKVFRSVAQADGVPLAVQNVRPLPANDPDGLSKIYLMIALLAPSLTFGNMLITRISPRLHPLLHVAVIAVYAGIIAAVAIALADAGLGALTGAPWALFGIGALLAFGVAVTGAAASRWAGGAGYLVIALLFVPVGIAASGLTLGPNMITQWYADVGKALPPGASITAVNNASYFSGNGMTIPLVVLGAWALAGTIAMVMAAILRPPLPGHRSQSRGQPDTTTSEIGAKGGHPSPPS